MIMIPVKLGLRRIEPYQISQIRYIFNLPQNVGIIGGHQENKQALYFVGLLEERQETDLVYLDPHFIQQSSPPDLSTHHTAKVGLSKLTQSAESICTDMTFGFYLRDLQDFCEWRSELHRLREYFTSE